MVLFVSLTKMKVILKLHLTYTIIITSLMGISIGAKLLAMIIMGHLSMLLTMTITKMFYTLINLQMNFIELEIFLLHQLVT